MPFKTVESIELPRFNARALLREHESGARHARLVKEGPRSFCAGARLHPEDGTGAGHALEHLLLSGSRRYPMEPFALMMGRSFARDMNALTDRHCMLFPFSTPSQGDFESLLDIYLDGLFEPLIEQAAFDQEVWRLEPDAKGRARLNGVVLNEMRSLPPDPAWRALMAARRLLWGAGPMGDEPGGEPHEIIELSAERLRALAAKAIVPANLFFASCGPGEGAEVEARLEERLSGRSLGERSVWSAPEAPAKAILGEAKIPALSGVEGADAFAVAWRFEPSADGLDPRRWSLLAQTLWGHSDAPLAAELQKLDLAEPIEEFHIADGRGSIGLCVDALSGKRDAREARGALWRGLEKAKQAKPEDVARALRRLRLAEAQGEGSRSMSEWAIGAVEAGIEDLGLAAQFAGSWSWDELEREALEPGWAGRLCERWMSANEARAELFGKGDEHWVASREARLAAFERDAQARVDADGAQLEALRARAAAIGERQAGREAARAALPMASASEARSEADVAPLREVAFAGRQASLLADDSLSGAAQARVSVALPGVGPEQGAQIALLCSIAGELGVGEMGWREASAWRSREIPLMAIGCHWERRPGEAGSGQWVAWAQGAAFEPEAGALLRSLAKQLGEIKVEGPRLAWALEQAALDLADAAKEEAAAAAEDWAEDQAVGACASRRADGALSRARALSRAAREASDKKGLSKVKRRLEEAAAALARGIPSAVVCAGEGALESPELLGGLEEALGSLGPLEGGDGEPAEAEPSLREPGGEGGLALFGPWAGNENFEWRPAPKMGEAGAAEAALASAMVELGFLSEARRERGGAYGASAIWREEGAVSLSSWSDPQVSEAFEDFAAADGWMAGLEGARGEEILAEARLLLLGEEPAKGLSRALGEREARDMGWGPQARRDWRARLFAASLEEAKAAWAAAAAGPRLRSCAIELKAKGRAAGLGMRTENALRALGLGEG